MANLICFTIIKLLLKIILTAKFCNIANSLDETYLISSVIKEIFLYQSTSTKFLTSVR